MAQIFISHSAIDTEYRNFVAQAGASTKVKLIFEEIEKIADFKQINSEKIKKDIQDSIAVFIILSRNVNNQTHTRDWVLWESGIACSKDVWVFEEASESGQVSVLMPSLRHYVIWTRHESFLAYFIRIINSYDDSNLFPTMAATAVTGAAFGGIGAAFGAVAGMFLADQSKKRPPGLAVTCQKCKSSYQLHYPEGLNFFRCPVCNTQLYFPR